MKVQNVKPSDIIIESRFRQELGSLTELIASIEDKGILQPIILNKDKHLIAGYRRLSAALELDLPLVPCVLWKTEDELDEREIELIENLHRKDMSWSETGDLRLRIHALLVEKHGDDWTHSKTAISLGISRSALSMDMQLAEAVEMFPELKKKSTANDARKAVKRLVETSAVNQAMEDARVRQKEGLLQVAHNHYIIGDTFEGMANEKEGWAYFAEVDPPYAISLIAKKSSKTANIDEYNEIDEENYPEFLEKLCAAVYRSLAKDSYAIFWYGPSWHTEVYQQILNAGFKLDPIPGIWYKENSGGQSSSPNLNLARNYEPFFIARKGIPELRQRGRSNVFAFQPVTPQNKVHPTERPIELIRELLRTFTYPTSVLNIPFLGSGNTLLAAYMEGMRGKGWELTENLKSGFLSKAHKIAETQQQETADVNVGQTSSDPEAE